LSEEAGLSVSYLNDIEHDRTVPSLGKLKDIAAGLGISVVKLLTGVDPYG
jgi:transcriptional regulator with XRE-family HTH domain